MPSVNNDPTGDPLPYILCHVGSETIPLFLDSGAEYSLISSKTIHFLGVVPSLLSNPIRLIPASGDPVPVMHVVDLLLDAGESLDDEIPHILLSVQRSYLKGSGDRKEGRKEKRNKAYLVLLLVDETSLFL